jgi:putative DNA methylase
MREEAARRIGHLYPEATLSDGSKATVIAWLWARTVCSPDPAAKGAMVPLVSSFMLSTKEGKKAWIEPVFDTSAPDGWRFEVHAGRLAKAEEDRLKGGTKTARGNFACLLTGAAITEAYNRAQGIAGKIGHRMIAIVTESRRGRIFISAKPSDESVAASAVPPWGPDGELYPRALGFRVPAYGITNWSDLYTPRQLVTLTTFSDLLAEIRIKIDNDTAAVGTQSDVFLDENADYGSRFYSDAIVTYLAFLIDQMANHSSILCGWNSANTQMRSVFSRQALSMTWDYAEVNLFSDSSGSFSNLFERMIKAFSGLSYAGGEARISNSAAQDAAIPRGCAVATDPPYYDNIGYADLSDFFYSWLRKNLADIWPDLFRRILTPKENELVATPHRHGGVDNAYEFFMNGMGEALRNMRSSTNESTPLTIFYAFKQSENADEGITSAGWSSFLQAVVDAGLIVDGTWPLDTEKKGRVRDIGTNALASSIVLVCRKRFADADIATRAEFIRTLKREMPDAIATIRRAGVGPVDMQQSVIGPGMGVFTRFAKVLEDDDSAMPVKTALSLINRVWDEIENELTEAFDAPTQVALAWFATYGFDARPSGELIVLANAKNIPLATLFSSGVFQNLQGKAGLVARADLPEGWSPATDKAPTVWECVQHTIRVLNAEDGGAEAAAALVAQMGQQAEDARALAYRLFEIATQKGWASEALIYNALAQEWPRLAEMAPDVIARGPVAAAQATLF